MYVALKHLNFTVFTQVRVKWPPRKRIASKPAWLDAEVPRVSRGIAQTRVEIWRHAIYTENEGEKVKIKCLNIGNWKYESTKFMACLEKKNQHCIGPRGPRGVLNPSLSGAMGVCCPGCQTLTLFMTKILHFLYPVYDIHDNDTCIYGSRCLFEHLIPGSDLLFCLHWYRFCWAQGRMAAGPAENVGENNSAVTEGHSCTLNLGRKPIP